VIRNPLVVEETGGAGRSHSRHCRRRLARSGDAIVKAVGSIPCSTCFQVTGRAIGNPGRARGDQVSMAVEPRPLRR
jgi:hypothetical protein